MTVYFAGQNVSDFTTENNVGQLIKDTGATGFWFDYVFQSPSAGSVLQDLSATVTGPLFATFSVSGTLTSSGGDEFSTSNSPHQSTFSFWDGEGNYIFFCGFNYNSGRFEGRASLIAASDLAYAEYDNARFYVGYQETNPRGMSFSPSGTKMFVVGSSSTSIYQYTLSTAFDISTASYDDISLSVSSQDSSPRAVKFNTNGTKMFMIGTTTDSVYQYTLSTAFDISTAVYDGVSFSIASEDLSPADVTFNTNGTKMFMLGYNNASVFQYTLSTAFDISTAVYDGVSFSVASEDTGPISVDFLAGGTKMLVLGTTTDSVYQYTLSTAFDISTAVYDGVSFSIASEETSPQSIVLSADEAKMFVLGLTGDDVNQYRLGAYADIDIGPTATGKYDFRIEPGVGLKIWRNRILLAEYLGNVGNAVSTTNGVGRIGVGNGDAAAEPVYSGVIVADFDTRLATLETITVNSTPTTDTSTGGDPTTVPTSVNNTERSTYEANNLVTFNADGQKLIYAQSNTITVPAGSSVAAVVMSHSGVETGSSPVPNLTPIIAVGGTEYTGTAIPLTTDRTYAQTIFETNPATSAAWGSSDVNGLSLGLSLNT